ncbi:uncharacterized protein LOC120911247 [Rana temporaria]|uniref:uncharacterized protein LOC120911247 n=1 Tax=Rana temporaria TaxID=8407 RepID=UPI001AAD3359|nr:uncharacterized protein LOC120911247 [Rana temporaria]
MGSCPVRRRRSCPGRCLQRGIPDDRLMGLLPRSPVLDLCWSGFWATLTWFGGENGRRRARPVGNWGFRDRRRGYGGWGYPGCYGAELCRRFTNGHVWDRPPDVLVIHAGGNDLGVRSMLEIARDIKFDFQRLRLSFPETVVVWSDMVARTSWRMARSVDAVNRARRKLNRNVGRFVLRNGGLVVRHPELEVDPWRYLRSDGVHLTDVGIDMWALRLEEGVQQAMRVWRCARR